MFLVVGSTAIRGWCNSCFVPRRRRLFVAGISAVSRSTSTTTSTAAAAAANRSSHSHSRSTTTASAAATATAPASEWYDVVVVGAGWAGLAARQRLLAHPSAAGGGTTSLLRVKLIEARDYVGGRSRTVRRPALVVPVRPNEEGPPPTTLPVEWGAEWVYPGSSVHRMLQQLNCQSTTSDNNCINLPYGVTESQFHHGHTAMYHSNNNEGIEEPRHNQWTPQKMEARLDQWWTGKHGFLQFAEERARAMTAHGTDANFAQTLRDYFDQMTQQQCSSSSSSCMTLEDQQFVLGLAHSEIVNEYAGSLQDCSVQAIAPFLRHTGTMSYMGVPGGGYDRLIDALVEQPHQPQLAAAPIQLRSTVTAIQYSSSSATPGAALAHVTYTDPVTGAVHTVSARAVLVTVPLGVLQAGDDIAFTPPLPANKQKAIHAIGFGTLNKCILYWQDDDDNDNNNNDSFAWWPEGHTWLNLITTSAADAGNWTTFFNPQAQNGGVRILTGFIAGAHADAMLQQQNDDAQIQQIVMANLRIMLGGAAVPEPTTVTVVRWNQDVFAKGSYSFPLAAAAASTEDDGDPGPSHDDDAAARTALARPVGNLFFAGEATDRDWYGTTAGAYDSGVRAGDEIMAALEAWSEHDMAEYTTS